MVGLGRVAQRQEAAPCGFKLLIIFPFANCASVPVPMPLVVYDEASCRFATPPPSWDALAGRRGRPTECCTVPDKLALPTGTVPLFQQAARGQRRPISLFSHAARHFDKKNPIGFLFPAPKLAGKFAATLFNRASSTGVHPFSGGPADPATKRGRVHYCPLRSIIDLSPFARPPFCAA